MSTSTWQARRTAKQVTAPAAALLLLLGLFAAATAVLSTSQPEPCWAFRKKKPMTVYDGAVPLWGRQKYYDMLIKSKYAETGSEVVIADTYAQMTKKIAKELMPMIILIPVGKRAIESGRDINRDFCNARVDVANAEARQSIAGVAGMTVGVCVVTLSLAQLFHACMRVQDEELEQT
mmetsp:Transcript_30401/g.59633  ORF Transcript_30401/g.59633 Transcript_30401/m.59633 type:complete len:177 (-) Transcript_30401:79-609(-)